MFLKKIIKNKLSSFIQHQLSQTNAELSKIKIELSKLKDELSKTRAELSQTKTENYSLFQQLKRQQKTLISNFSYHSKTKQKKKVVYTCLTGNYDELYLPEYIDYEWDYICFTDNKELLKNDTYGIWKIHPLKFSELDNSRNNRWHKTHPHILFPNYEASLYIDSNLIIRSNWIFKEIEKNNRNLIIPIHFERDCIYDEIEYVKDLKFDDIKKIQKMTDFLIKNEKDFPHNYGLTENNCIYRRHNEPTIIEMMEEWWSFIRDYSKRDQISLSYVLWKHSIKPADISIPNLRTRYKDFQFTTHLPSNNNIAVLPDYPLEQAEIKYSIDFIKATLNHTFISGWAFLQNHKGGIFIGDINSRIFVAKPNEINLNFTGVIAKFGRENEIYNSTKISRPDVQKAFNLETADVGFSIECDTFISDFKIYIVDDGVKKIFFTDYHV